MPGGARWRGGTARPAAAAAALLFAAAGLRPADAQRHRRGHRQQQEEEQKPVETPEEAKKKAMADNKVDQEFFQDLYTYPSDEILKRAEEASGGERSSRGVEYAEDEDVGEGGEREGGQQVADTKRMQMLMLEEEHRTVNNEEVHPARLEYQMRMNALNREKNTGGSSWFWSQEKKARVAALEGEAAHAAGRLKMTEAKAMAVYAKLKPMYGVVSRQHWREQKRQVSKSMGIAGSVAYNHMIWETLFNTRAENFGDLIAQVVMNYVMGWCMGYVFAFIHFAFSAPWIIYEYCTGWGDLPAAVLMWVLGLVLFLLPMIAMCFCCGIVYKATEKQRAELRQQQRAQHERQQALRRQRIAAQGAGGGRPDRYQQRGGGGFAY